MRSFVLQRGRRRLSSREYFNALYRLVDKQLATTYALTGPMNKVHNVIHLRYKVWKSTIRSF